MEIIEKGNPNRIKNGRKIRFQCKECFCLWQAVFGEYVYIGTPRDGDEWYMECPCCGTKTYSRERIGW